MRWRMKNAVKSFLCAALAGMVCLFSVVTDMKTFRANAAESDYSSYDETPIEDDMGHIDVMQYPKNEDGKASLISFMEYCYSEKPFLSEAYGIFLYVYNPTEKPLRTEALANNVQMAYRIGETESRRTINSSPLCIWTVRTITVSTNSNSSTRHNSWASKRNMRQSTENVGTMFPRSSSGSKESGLPMIRPSLSPISGRDTDRDAESTAMPKVHLPATVKIS